VVHALKLWRCYLEGAAKGFTVVTDHCPLTFLSTQAEPVPPTSTVE
jgi:spore maturation protein SpmB